MFPRKLGDDLVTFPTIQCLSVHLNVKILDCGQFYSQFLLSENRNISKIPEKTEEKLE
jgi:hypothetical protein